MTPVGLVIKIAVCYDSTFGGVVMMHFHIVTILV